MLLLIELMMYSLHTRSALGCKYTLTGAFYPVANPDSLAIQISRAVALADTRVGVVLQMRHGGISSKISIWDCVQY